ncbi:hypothetical protein BDZ97DRAFT_1679585 [Flammula alnicola]|nr:hypothetical protein BDZ97DRAFT_1679585 [Flammula alnicola]
MRVTQPHAVYGPKPTICYSSHFCLTHLMEATSQGLLHAFIINEFITNTSHCSSCHLLCHIVDFYYLGLIEKIIPLSDPSYCHLLQVNTFQDLINLLFLCNLVILANVLDFCTYLAPNQPEEKDLSSS